MALALRVARCGLSLTPPVMCENLHGWHQATPMFSNTAPSAGRSQMANLPPSKLRMYRRVHSYVLPADNPPPLSGGGGGGI